MCSKNIFLTLGFWVGLPQNLGFDFSVRFLMFGSKPTADRSWQEVAHPDSAEYMHIGSPGDILIRANFAPRRMQLWSELPIRLGHMPPVHDEL